MIVEQITYSRTEGTYDSAIFTAEKNSDFYKSLADIIDVIGESVDILEVLKPIYNFKAN